VIFKGVVAGSLSGDPVFELGFYDKCERESEPFTLLQKLVSLVASLSSKRMLLGFTVNDVAFGSCICEFVPAP